MAGLSLSTLDELQEQLRELDRLALEEFRTGPHRDMDLVAELQKEREILIAQIDRLPSAESLYHAVCAVLYSITCFRLHTFTSMDAHVIVTCADHASLELQVRSAVAVVHPPRHGCL